MKVVGATDYNIVQNNGPCIRRSPVLFVCRRADRPHKLRPAGSPSGSARPLPHHPADGDALDAEELDHVRARQAGGFGFRRGGGVGEEAAGADEGGG
jgi:hypothetical protein